MVATKFRHFRLFPTLWDDAIMVAVLDEQAVEVERRGFQTRGKAIGLVPSKARRRWQAGAKAAAKAAAGAETAGAEIGLA